ncbi:MAG: hypothetical protein Q4G69_10585 [Planctomycetia bacterium]|nr:hypothetical protein [Planctomycetia bacterium]
MKILQKWVILSAAILMCLKMISPFLAAAKEFPVESEETVGLFSAMEQGQVDVKLTLQNSKSCTIRIKNKGEKALRIEMPSTFAASPVLAQLGLVDTYNRITNAAASDDRGGGGYNAFGAGYSPPNAGGSNYQSVGGGSGKSSSGGGGKSGGAFFIAPEKSVFEKVRIVCLEHGKKDPRPSVEYQIMPLDRFTKNKTTQVLCQMLGDPNVDHYSIQAAVWNEENNISFNELARKTTEEMGTNVKHSYFTASQLQTGMNILTFAREKAKKLKKAENEQMKNIHQTKEGPPVLDRTIEKLTDRLINE